VALIAADKRNSADASANAADPWGQAQGWRLNGDYRRVLSFGDEFAAGLEGGAYKVGVVYHPQGWELDVDGVRQPLGVTGHDGASLSIRLGGQSMHGAVRRDGDLFHVFTNGEHFALAYKDPMAHAGEAEAAGGRLTAPMPGKVVAVMVEGGQEVKKGDPLVIMEAMKMEHTIAAPSDGLVEEVLYAVGDQVADGAPLLAFKAG
jgi:3-methylcrotonyl-CoA carboxylase alpha subunit